jgi:hypothetical protein
MKRRNKSAALSFYQHVLSETMSGGKMKVLERMVQKIGDWQNLEEADQKYNAIESKYGFPAKRRYQALAGPHAMDTLIIEREWESMAAMEEAFSRLQTDTEYQALSLNYPQLVVSNQWELYLVM